MAKKGKREKRTKTGSGESLKPRTKNNNATSAKTGKAKKNRPAVLREDHPGMVVPAVLAVILLLVLGAADKYGFVSRVPALLGGGLVVFLLFCLAPLYYNKNYLYPRDLKLVSTMAVLVVFLCGGGMFYFAVWSQPPVVEQTLDRATPNANLQLDAGHYALYIVGAFLDESVHTDDKKKRGMKVNGNFKIAMSSSQGADLQETFAGRFDQIRKKRKLSKKNRGYQEIVKTDHFQRFTMKRSGPVDLRLEELSETLQDELRLEIYHAERISIFLLVLGVVGVLLGNFVDSVIRSSRITSLFGPSLAAVLGFAAYFYYESSPAVRFSTMAIDVLVGGIVGVLIAYGLFNALRTWYASLALKRGISL